MLLVYLLMQVKDHKALLAQFEEQTLNNILFSSTMVGLYGVYRRFFDFYYSYDMFYNNYWPHLYYNLSDSHNVDKVLKNTINNFLSAYEGYLECAREFNLENYNFDLFLCYLMSYLLTVGVLTSKNSLSDFLSLFHSIVERWSFFRDSTENISNSLRISLIKKREYKHIAFSTEDASSIYAFILIFASLSDDRVYNSIMQNSVTFRKES